jgi:hypothetical protein
MNKLMGTIALSALLIGVQVLALRQSATAGPRCKIVSGGITSFLRNDCPTPTGFCTAGTFFGDGLLNGTTHTTVEAIAAAAGGLLGEVPTTLSFTGLITFETNKGILTVRDTGIYDTAGQGLFSSRSLVIGGTGEFVGATGFLFTHGTGLSELQTVVTGEVCLTQ